MIRYTQEQREQAVIKLSSGANTAKEIAAEIGASESTLYAWERRLLGERRSALMSSKRAAKRRGRTSSPANQGDLADEKQALLQHVEALKADIHRLQMERDILEKAGELLIKG